MSVTKLHITYHNILKRNIGLSKYESTSATCAYTNTQCCQSTIRNLVFKFVCRLNTSDNALIKAVLASSVVYSSEFVLIGDGCCMRERERERERHYIYCRCLQTVTLAIGYYNRHIHYIHSGDG